LLAAGDNLTSLHANVREIKHEKNQPYLAGQRAIYIYRVLREYQNGEREVASMQHVSSFLSDEALLAVSSYYASLTPIHEPGSQEAAEEHEPLDADPFTGIRERIEKCTKCHGETGNSTASGMPNLTAQDPEYFVTSMRAYVDGSRNHKLMKKLVGKLDEQTTGEMSIFYAVQQPGRTETQGEGDADPCPKRDCHENSIPIFHFSHSFAAVPNHARRGGKFTRASA